MTADTLHPLVVSQDYASDLDRAVQQVRNQVLSSEFVDPLTTGRQAALLVILERDVAAGGSVLAERQIATTTTYIDVRIVRDNPARPVMGEFRIGESEPIPSTATAADVQRAALAAGHRLLVTGGPRQETDVPQESPQRWRIRSADENEVPSIRALQIREGSLSVTPLHWRGSGDWIRVEYPATAPARLPAGTQCHVEHYAGRGWVIVEYEDPTAPGGLTGTRYDPCLRQALRAGDTDACEICLPGETPLQLQVGGQGLQEAWDEISRILDVEIEHPDEIDVTLLEHDDECRWESDHFFEGRFFWVLTLHGGTDGPPQAQLQLRGTETIYNQQLQIVYWSQDPFCALSRNRLLKINHASQGTIQVPRELLPPCLLISPYNPPCIVTPPGAAADYSAYDCVRNWHIRIFGTGPNDFTWQAGPRRAESEPEPDRFGCEWPGQEHRLTFVVLGDQTIGSGGWFNPAPPPGSSWISVGSYPSGILVDVSYGVRLLTSNTTEWRLTAVVRVGDLPFPANVTGRPYGNWEYSLVMQGPLGSSPACEEEFTLTYSGSELLPTALPHEITLRPSTLL